MGAPLDLVGKLFGYLLVIRATRDKRGIRAWQCECSCGKKTVVETGRLTSGNTRSCGCRKREVLGESTLKHGMTGTRTHRIWKAMRSRCTNPNISAYSNYGGRGISVCKRWDKFTNFLEDMGEAPVGKSIDRIDNDGNYEKRNCRWATPQEQAHNMRTNRRVTFQGKTKLLIEWARELHVDASTLRKQWVKKGIII